MRSQWGKKCINNNIVLYFIEYLKSKASIFSNWYYERVEFVYFENEVFFNSILSFYEFHHVLLYCCLVIFLVLVKIIEFWAHLIGFVKLSFSIFWFPFVSAYFVILQQTATVICMFKFCFVLFRAGGFPPNSIVSPNLSYCILMSFSLQIWFELNESYQMLLWAYILTQICKL